MVQINHKGMREVRINPLISSVLILIKMNRMFQRVKKLMIIRKPKEKKVVKKRRQNRMKSSLKLNKQKNLKTSKKKARRTKMMKMIMI